MLPPVATRHRVTQCTTVHIVCQCAAARPLLLSSTSLLLPSAWGVIRSVVIRDQCPHGSCGETAPRVTSRRSQVVPGRRRPPLSSREIRTSSRKRGLAYGPSPLFRHPCCLHEEPLPLTHTLSDEAVIPLRSRSTSRSRHFRRRGMRCHHHQLLSIYFSPLVRAALCIAPKKIVRGCVHDNDVFPRHITFASLTPRACPTRYCTRQRNFERDMDTFMCFVMVVDGEDKPSATASQKLGPSQIRDP
ncbi:hypothetical protein EDB87DRAFT_1130519 [Lactarius vividus]|nr:hypothetical protein EDB87DRAFT_1130519 [Lactarius vividus]